MSWRVFVGDWDPEYPDDHDWAHLDVVVDDWAQGRDMLVDRLRCFESDSCPVCWADAAAGVATLLGAEPGTGVEIGVEGEQYVLVAADAGTAPLTGR